MFKNSLLSSLLIITLSAISSACYADKGQVEIISTQAMRKFISTVNARGVPHQKLGNPLSLS